MRYRYMKDPLFLFCLLLYCVNRWVLKPYFPNPISKGYLNDLICLPFWVPIMLFIMRRIGLRTDDLAPQSYEVLIPLVMWSWVFEALLPRVNVFRGLATSDHLDIFCYTLGAFIASIFWKTWYGEWHTTSA
jgi:hypothetical protein